MLKAVFFDMDGTITRPYLDFRVLRELVGAPPGVPIMAHIEALTPPAREQAERVLAQAEYEAATRAELNTGVLELLVALAGRGLQRVLITNNHRRAMVHIVQRHALPLDLLLSREDGAAKPAPDLVHLALRRLGLATHEAVFVGDGRFDQLASEAAGVRYVHLANDGVAAEGAPTIHALEQLWEALGLGPPDV